MIMRLNLFEKTLLVQIQIIRTFATVQISLLLQFEQFESGSKMYFSNKLSHVIIHFEENSAGSKVKRRAYASRGYLLQIRNWIKSYTPVYIRENTQLTNTDKSDRCDVGSAINRQMVYF